MSISRKRLGILTGGGDCPGLNAAIRAVVKTAINIYGYEVIGFKDGYKGLVTNRFTKLGLEDVSGLLDQGGTILGTTNSYNPFEVATDHDGEKQVKDLSGRIAENLKMHDIEGLIIIGGINTIWVAEKLSKLGINIVAIPRTIENEVPGSDVNFGFMTAVNTATQAIDKLHSTAESHHRVMIVEVMGRRTGWVALESGIAGGADIILIPEIPYDIHSVARHILERKNSGKGFSIICVAESCKKDGTKQNTKHIDFKDEKQIFNGVGSQIAVELEKLTQLEVRVMVLGYLQRGGEPSSYDRILSTRLGVEAVNMAARGDYNKMVCIKNQETKPVPLSEIAGKVKSVPVDGELVSIARNTGVSFGD